MHFPWLHTPASGMVQAANYVKVRQIPCKFRAASAKHSFLAGTILRPHNICIFAEAQIRTETKLPIAVGAANRDESLGSLILHRQRPLEAVTLCHFPD